ncbi:MAG: endonuclease/exonuclease/phosphatase family protein [Vitreoscilla sp.]|nr:endonuclease/exonuclease/phosphatase family protein [Vitreoscilla sp.]
MKLITWNIQWGRGVDGRVDLDRVVAHAQRFADFDVLCVQEVSAGHHQLSGCDGSDQFEQLATRLGGYEPVAGVATDVLGSDGRRRRFGNMLFSRLPVRQVFRHLLPWPVEAGVMSMQRVAIEATLDTPLGLLRVTTTHLEYYSAHQRAAQIDRLRELHREAVAHARSPRPGTASDGAFEPMPRAAAAVLVGDLNFKPGDPDHSRLLAPMGPGTPAYRDAWELAHACRPHVPTVGVHDKEQWPGEPFTFDFVCVSEDIAGRVCDVRVDETTTASDHQPMLLELA